MKYALFMQYIRYILIIKVPIYELKFKLHRQYTTSVNSHTLNLMPDTINQTLPS